MGDDLRERVKDAAQANGRSINSEIIHRLEESFYLLEPELRARLEDSASTRHRTITEEIEIRLRESFDYGAIVGGGLEEILNRFQAALASLPEQEREDFSYVLARVRESSFSASVAIGALLAQLTDLLQSRNNPDEESSSNLWQANTD